MRDTEFTVRVPGKAMLAGEYAVLAGAPALVAAVDRFLECDAAPASRWSIEGNGARWQEGEPEPSELRFALEARRLALAYREGKGQQTGPLALRLRDGLRAPDGRKLGLGGSAATCVAVVSAVLHPRRDAALDRALVYKLAATAHAAAQGKAGSGVDVCACTYGGIVWTRRFDAEPFLAAARGGPKAFALAVDRSAAPEVERVVEGERPSRSTCGGVILPMLLVFSGQSAATAPLIQAAERFRERNPSGFAIFLARTSAAADRMRRALLRGDLETVAKAADEAGDLLAALGGDAGVPIVVEAHRELIALARACGAGAKVSGAGGGDCCLVVGTAAAVDQARSALRQRKELTVPVAIADGVGFVR